MREEQTKMYIMYMNFMFSMLIQFQSKVYNLYYLQFLCAWIKNILLS